MAQYKYTFNQVDTKAVISPNTYTAEDQNLLTDFKVNTSYDQAKNFIELHYYTLDGRLLQSVEDYTNIQSTQSSGTANQGTLDSLTLRVEDDLKIGGFEYGDVYLYYNFLNDPYTSDKSKSQFFIEEISPDRLEVRLLNRKLTDKEVLSRTAAFKEKLTNADSSEFRLNLGSNNLLLATNIDTLDYKEFKSVVVRLYNPLPDYIGIKTTLYITEQVSDPVAFSSTAELLPELIKVPVLKGPNFNVEVGKETSQPSEYFNINELFSYPVTSSYYEVKSLFEEKGANISIDHTDYSDFVNFSSAEERLRNFKYKLDLIETYQSESNRRVYASNNEAGVTGSREYYERLINSVLSNFDHYDRFLYYETGSHSWPKTGESKPYTIVTGSSTGSWFDSNILSASNYDIQNSNQLINTIPEYLREDPDNVKYNTFVHMVAQHFDNLWIYSKAVTDKYDTDNRLDFGISKDLIEDALKNFGVKLYSSNKSTQELFKMFTGETYNTGSESYVDTVITGSTQITSEENYRKQIYKRLYHNLPLLLKSKGTERGFRALLNTFGIPSLQSDTGHSKLSLTQIGGTLSGSYNLGEYQYTTSSSDKIRIDNTGSLEGNTLSQYTNIIQRDSKYANDLNIVEAGFSPASALNEYIIASASAENFDIDSILGDPRLAHSSSYDDLTLKAATYLTPVTGSQYNLKDFTRLLKFYDNVLFKTIKDFIPARTNISTGVIIKPHLLERSKIKQVKGTFEQHNEYSSSIEVITQTGSNAGSFGAKDQYSASYSTTAMTSGGLAVYNYHNHEEAKFDGELSGSYIKLSSGELNEANIYKYSNNVKSTFILTSVSSSANASTPTPTPTPTLTATPTSTPAPTPTLTATATAQYGTFTLYPAYGLSFSSITNSSGTIPSFAYDGTTEQLQMVDSYTSTAGFVVEVVGTPLPGQVFKVELRINGSLDQCIATVGEGSGATLTPSVNISQFDNVTISIAQGTC